MAGKAAEAYIVMRADGTLLPKDVKSYAKRAGKEAAEEMSEEFDREFLNATKSTQDKFVKNVGRALATADFSDFRKKGESVEQVYMRLNKTMVDLNKNKMLSDAKLSRFYEAFSEYEQVERAREEVERHSKALIDQNKAMDTYTRADTKRRADEYNGLTKVANAVDNLVVSRRGLLDRDIEKALLSESNNWDHLIKRYGSAGKASEALGKRMEELLETNSRLEPQVRKIVSAWKDYRVASVEAAGAAERQASSEAQVKKALDASTAASKRMSNSTKDATKWQEDFDKALMSSEKTLASLEKAERNRVKGLSNMSTIMSGSMDDHGDAVDRLVDKVVRGQMNWYQYAEEVKKTGVVLDDNGRKWETVSDAVEKTYIRMRTLNKEGAITDENFREITATMGEFIDEHGELTESHRRSSDAMREFRRVQQEVSAEVDRGHAGRDQFVVDLGRIGDRAGRTFGKGGRNDVLHFFGTLVGGITKFALTAPVKLFNTASVGVDTFSKSFEMLTKSVAEGGSGMTKGAGMVRALGMAAMKVGPSVAAGAVAVVAFSAAAGALASALSLVVANFLVLAGTITQAIVAPLLAAIPLITAFGAGAVVAGGAIYKWAQESKALEQAMKPVSRELDRLAERITPTMDKLVKLFGSGMTRMVRAFGDSVSNVLDDLYAKLSDPAMDQFYDKWAVSMPRIFESLGNSIGSFGQGLTAFFVPILPYAERLGNAIERSAKRFADWAMSAQGQNAIADWMRDAWEIAKDLWSGIRDIGGAIMDVMGIGVDESGGGFAKWVRDIGKDFRTWTESEEGREKIKQWFDDAEELAKDVWSIVVLIGKAFDALDSPAGRTMLNAFMAFLTTVAVSGYIAAAAMNAVNIVVVGFFGKVRGFAEDFIGFWKSIFEGDLAGAVEHGISAVERSLLLLTPWESFEEAGEAIDKALKDWFDFDIGAAWDSAWQAVESAISGSVDWISSKASEVWDAVKGWFDIDWGGIWDSIQTAISDWFTGLKDWLTSKGDEVGEEVKGWFDIDWSGVLDSITDFLADMAYQAGLGIGKVARFFYDLPGKIRDIDWSGMWEGFKDSLSGAWDSVTQWTSDTWNSFSNWASQVPGRIREGLSSLASSIGESLSGAWDAISQWTSDTWDSFSEWASGVPERIREGLSGMASSIGETLSSTWESVSTWASDMGDAIVSWVENIDWGQTWEDLKSGIWEGLTGIGEWLLEQGSKLFDGFVQGVKDGLGIASPSTVMIQLMQDVGQGILQGLMAIPSLIWGAVSGLFEPLLQSARELPGKVMSALSTLGSTIGTVFSTVTSTIGTTVSGWWSSIGGALSTWGGKAVSALSGFASSIGSALSGVASRIGTAVSGWWSSIGSTLSSWGGKAKTALSSFGTSVKSSFDSAKTAATQKAGELVSSARGKLSEMGSKASSALSSLGTNVKSKFDSAKSTATTTASSLVSSARSTLATMGSKASSALSNLSSSVKSRFNSAKSSATSTASSLVSSARSKLATMGSRASSALSNLASSVRSRFNTAKSSATSTASSLVSSARSALSRMSGQASSALAGVAGSVRSRFNAAKNAAISVAGSIVSGVRGRLSGVAGAVGSALSGVQNAITRPFSAAKAAVERILGSIRSLASRAASIGGSIRGKIPGFASGGTVFGSQIARVGETGPEAIVPLNRPLAQVDPSVRGLAAVAQGKAAPGGGGTTVAAGAIQINSPYSDPELVANRVLDDLVANL